MDVTLSLSDDHSTARRNCARALDTSMAEAAREAVRRLTHATPAELLSARVIAEDAELLHSLPR